MESLKKNIQYYDKIWKQVEKKLPKLLRQKPGEAIAEVKELSALVTLIKRTQDAHRVILLDSIKIQEPTRNAKDTPKEEKDPIDDQEISRLLTLLKESDGEDEEEDPATERM